MSVKTLPRAAAAPGAETAPAPRPHGPAHPEGRSSFPKAASGMHGDAISFGPFRLIAAQRLLLEGETPVRLGSRAFDILAALVERAGEVVGKGELIARAWPERSSKNRI
jgi:DNA-binding winged-HTH domains